MGYKSITLYSDTKVDYLVWLSGIPTAPQIETANAWGYLPLWKDYTNAEILAPFTSSLISSYISGLTSPLTGYVIYRGKVGESKISKVAEVDTTVYSIIDYNVANNTQYIYIVFPVTEIEVGVSMTSDPLTSCWWNWSATELLKISDGVYTIRDIFLFDANLESEDNVQNLDQTIYQTYSKYPKSSVGSSNFKTIGFSALLNRVDKTTHIYSDTVALKNSWDEFVVRGNYALLKDPKGNIYCGIFQSPKSRVSDTIGTQPVTIDISFTELASMDDITVYEEIR